MWIYFELTELAEYLIKLSLALLFLDMTLRYYECALFVDKVAGADPARYPTVDSVPLSFEIRLNLLQTVKCTHFLLRSWLRGRRRLIVGAA